MTSTCPNKNQDTASGYRSLPRIVEIHVNATSVDKAVYHGQNLSHNLCPKNIQVASRGKEKAFVATTATCDMRLT